MGYLKNASLAYSIDKIKSLLENKVEKQDGYSLISDEDLTQIATNKTDISTLNGAGEGSVDKKIALALSELTYLSKQIIDADTATAYTADPTQAEFNVIYLVKDDSASGSDVYKEYQRLGDDMSSTFEMTGDTSTDLSDYYTKTETDTALAGKVDVETGKRLSTNDYTDDEKEKLAGITESADAVSFTQSLTSGTVVGTLTVNGIDTTLYAPTNTNTHYTSKNVVGSSTATANTTSELTNGNVYLNSVENGAVTSSHKISGSGATTVTTDASGNIVITSTDTNTTYSAATTSSAGLMSASDKSKLNGIEESANNYSLPLATSSVRGGVKVGYTKNEKNYPVELDENERMYVNVPWETATEQTSDLDAFQRYYGLITTETNILSDGSIVITNSEATITVVKTENDDGSKVITETIVPIDGSVNYIKTSTIVNGTDGSKTITETYSENSK